VAISPNAATCIPPSFFKRIPLKEDRNYTLTKKPITKKPITKKPITKKPITKKPITKKPITKKPK
jgi:hypothetical protein